MSPKGMDDAVGGGTVAHLSMKEHEEEEEVYFDGDESRNVDTKTLTMLRIGADKAQYSMSSIFSSVL